MVERLQALPPLTCVTAFRQPQLPLRGVVDESFVRLCLEGVPDGAEYLVTWNERSPSHVGDSFFYRAGDSHAELRKDLEACGGVDVRVGLYPPWMVDTEDVLSAVVPDGSGEVAGGVY